MAEEAGQSRTEAPTPRRLQRAKEAGQFPISSELSICAALATGTLLLILFGPSLAEKLARRFIVFLAHPGLEPLRDLRHLAIAASLDAFPFIALPLLASFLAVGLQTGFSISTTPLLPSLDRISPSAGLKRLFARQNLVETGKAVAKLAAVAGTVYYEITASLPSIAHAPLDNPAILPRTLLSTTVHICLAVLAVQVLITILDLLWSRVSFIQNLRMTRQDIKEETKETEGDPFLKSRLRRLRQQRARQRIHAAVPKATVVVTNPTEYAVALSYDRARPGAPRIVAKGVNLIAARIRELAREHGIPLVANPPLARALYRLDVEAEIPPEHYKAVAEIIAYVWRLRAVAAANQTSPAL